MRWGWVERLVGVTGVSLVIGCSIGTVPAVAGPAKLVPPVKADVSSDHWGDPAADKVAKATGVYGQLTQHVLFEALRQCADWAADGLRMSVAVNLSAQIVSNSPLPELIRTALQTADVPAADLVLEITESSVMADPDRAVPVLERIAATGVTLSLDDFGTGYSSLAYLRRLPVGEVKIDRSFITGMVADDDASQVLVRAIINLAASLALRVVAEGAEDDQTVELLRAMGCDTVQGFAVSRPVSAAGITEFVRSRPVGSRTALRLVV